MKCAAKLFPQKEKKMRVVPPVRKRRLKAGIFHFQQRMHDIEKKNKHIYGERESDRERETERRKERKKKKESLTRGLAVADKEALKAWKHSD